jgi:carnitine 3-dehydrogenase
MKVGIVGGGQIGTGWANLLTRFGHSVRLFDAEPGRCRGAANLLEAVAGTQVVIEAVTEDEHAKEGVIRAISAASGPEVILASSSSSLLPSRLQQMALYPERVLVLHPLHPVEQIPVIEVVPGERSSQEVVSQAVQFVTDLGKVPVVLRREVPGYVVNRLTAALWREALDLVLTGVIEPEELDRAASKGPCLGWAVQGPFLTYHLAAAGGIGPFLEHLGPAFGRIWVDLADWTTLSEEAVERLAKDVGKAYSGRPRDTWEAERDRGLQAVVRVLAEADGLGRARRR